MQTCAPHVMWTRLNRSGLRSLSSHDPRGQTCPYQTLGLRPRADLKSIKSAYIALSKKYHPDVNADSESGEQFRAVAEAYELIGNATAKRRYDAKLAAEVRQNPFRDQPTSRPGRTHAPPPQYRAPPRPPDGNIHLRWEAYLNEERLKRHEREAYIRWRRNPFHVPDYDDPLHPLKREDWSTERYERFEAWFTGRPKKPSRQPMTVRMDPFLLGFLGSCLLCIMILLRNA